MPYRSVAKGKEDDDPLPPLGGPLFSGGLPEVLSKSLEIAESAFLTSRMQILTSTVSEH